MARRLVVSAEVLQLVSPEGATEAVTFVYRRVS